jgi:hypothetical protein
MHEIVELPLIFKIVFTLECYMHFLHQWAPILVMATLVFIYFLITLYIGVRQVHDDTGEANAVVCMLGCSCVK